MGLNGAGPGQEYHTRLGLWRDAAAEDVRAGPLGTHRAESYSINEQAPAGLGKDGVIDEGARWVFKG